MSEETKGVIILISVVSVLMSFGLSYLFGADFIISFIILFLIIGIIVLAGVIGNKISSNSSVGVAARSTRMPQEKWQMVSGVVTKLQGIDLGHYLSSITSAIEQARRDSNIELWSANLEAMNKELNTLADTIDHDVNRTIIPGIVQLQQHLLTHVQHYESELAKQGITISDHEVVELGRRRRLRFSFTYPKFARTRQLKRIELELGQNLGRIGVGVAKTGGSVGGLLVGAALAGIAVALHGQKRSKALRLLEEVTGQVYEHQAAVEELLTMAKAYGEEVHQVMRMFAECLDAMEATSDVNLLRYHVTEGKLLLTIEGIGRR